jgi:hypothetical protein
MTMPVSGPGPYSQRTDKQPIREVTGLPYGEGQALTEQQQSAGADRGPGPSSAVLGMRPRPAGTPLTEALSKAAANDPSGTLAALLMEAMKRGL